MLVAVVLVVPVARLHLVVMAGTLFMLRAGRRRGPLRERSSGKHREQGGDEERFGRGHVVRRPVSIGFDVAPNPLSGPGMCRACDHNGRRVGGVDRVTRKEMQRGLTSNETNGCRGRANEIGQRERWPKAR